MEQADQLDETINQALNLAYFIQGNKAIAVEIVTNALNKLEVAVQAQDKRLYYEPQGRSATRKARSKISFGEKHLLQRLIYLESEPFEKEKERDRRLSEEDMITHFIKHLVKITLKRNSFYVALGISRLLHNYSTAETMEIYNLVVQDPERVRDDYYYRSRKGRLMQEMKERFGNLLKVIKVNRGEERFETNGASAQYSGLVFDCLNHFTPWATACVIPTRFNPCSEIVQDLAFNNPDPDAEHQVEVNRTHSVMHPDCFTRLVRALKFNSPHEHLEIPNFFLAQNNETNNRHQPPGFGPDEINAIKARLGEQSRERKRFAAGLLKIRVDGIEVAEMDLQRASQIQLQIDEDAELIEVIGRNHHGELLLASCFLPCQASSGIQRITLEGGQEITFLLSHQLDRYGEIEETAIDLSYRETRAAKAAALTLKQQLNRFAEWLHPGHHFEAFKPALALALIALFAAALWFFTFRRSEAPPQQATINSVAPDKEEKQAETTPAPANQPEPQKAENNPDQKPKAPGIDREDSDQHRNTQVANNEIPRDLHKINPEGADRPKTRGTLRPAAGLPLQRVKAIGIQLSCDQAFCRQVKERMVQALSSSGRFVFTNEVEGADALLKLSDIAEAKNDGHPSIIVRLANRAGYVLFPANRGGSGARYSGSSEEVAQKLMRDLLKESGRFSNR